MGDQRAPKNQEDFSFFDLNNTNIAGSIADLQSLLVDVEEHVPKEEAFQKVEDERIRSSCNFRKVCESISDITEIIDLNLS